MPRHTKTQPQSAATNALADFARVFWDAAVSEVEAQIEAEEQQAAASSPAQATNDNQ
jgi:hypothetical protein